MTTIDGSQVTIHEVSEQGNSEEGSAPSDGSAAPGSFPAGLNPYIIAVWAIAAGLIIGGVVMLNRARDPFTSGPGGAGYMPLSLILLNVAPYALLAGTLTLVALMFWHAVLWRQRRKS